VIGGPPVEVVLPELVAPLVRRGGGARGLLASCRVLVLAPLALVRDPARLDGLRERDRAATDDATHDHGGDGEREALHRHRGLPRRRAAAWRASGCASASSCWRAA